MPGGRCRSRHEPCIPSSGMRPGQPVTVREHTFFPDLIAPGAAVIDAGAHGGEFARAVRAHCRGGLFLLEPAPDLFDRLSSEQDAVVRPWALAEKSASGTLNLGHNPESNSLRPLIAGAEITGVAVECVTLEDLLQRLEITRAALLKLDIEGAEIPVLQTASEETLQRFDQITVEFHAHTPDLDRDREEEAAAIRGILARLRKLGFVPLVLSRPFWIDVLFLNRRTLGLSLLATWHLQWQWDWWPRVRRALSGSR